MRPSLHSDLAQDRLWAFHEQDQGTWQALSAPRLKYLAHRCTPVTRVLNVGVGSGQTERYLLRRGCLTYALDPCPATIERLRQTLALGDRAQVGYGQAMPFSAGRFETVILSEVLEHLAPQVGEATLDEASRVLVPGGQLLVTVPYQEHLDHAAVYCPHCAERFHPRGHRQSFTKAQLIRTVREAQFHVTRCQVRTFPEWGWRGPMGLARSCARYVLGRMGEPLVWSNIYLEGRTR